MYHLALYRKVCHFWSRWVTGTEQVGGSPQVTELGSPRTQRASPVLAALNRPGPCPRDNVLEKKAVSLHRLATSPHTRGTHAGRVRAANPPLQLKQQGQHGDHGLERREGICGSAAKRSQWFTHSEKVLDGLRKTGNISCSLEFFCKVTSDMGPLQRL